jgi:DNA-binding response OmpR family regulator
LNIDVAAQLARSEDGLSSAVVLPCVTTPNQAGEARTGHLFYAVDNCRSGYCQGRVSAHRRALGPALARGGVMQLLIAHGDAASRLALRQVAAGPGTGDLEVVETAEGTDAIERLLGPAGPTVALIDWDLPGCDGPELCRLVREYHEAGPPYIILLARSHHNIADSLEAGADDCVRTPANAAELRARIKVGRRYAELPWSSLAALAPAASQTTPGPVVAAPLAASLDAVRVPEDEQAEGDGASRRAKFELQSVLVTP